MENFYFKHASHFGDMFSIFEEFYKTGVMTDVIIACDGKNIHAHKIVLSAGSDYFRRILLAIKPQSHFPVLFINDITYEDMKTILEFIYRGQIVVTRDKMESLRQAAYKLRVKGFENFLRNPFLKSNGMGLGNQFKVSNGTMRNISMLNQENTKRATPHLDPNENKRMRLSNGINISYDANRASGLPVFNRFKDEGKRVSNGHNENNLPKSFHSTPNNGTLPPKRIQMEHLLKRQHPIVPSVSRATMEALKMDANIIANSVVGHNELKMKPEPEMNSVSIAPVKNESLSPKCEAPMEESRDENEDNHRNENTENSGVIEKANITNEAMNLVTSGHSADAIANDDCDSDEAHEVNYTYEMDPTALSYDSYNDENMPENQDGDSEEGYEDEEDTFESPYNQNGVSLEAILNQANAIKLAQQMNQQKNGGSFFFCENCPKYFFDEDHLRLHIKRSHGLNKLNQCNICGKTYAWKSGLYKHKRHVHNIVSGKSLSQVNDNVMEPHSPSQALPMQMQMLPSMSPTCVLSSPMNLADQKPVITAQ